LAVAGVVSACVIVVAMRRTGRLRRVSLLVAIGLLASSLLWTVGSAQHAVAAIPVNWRITACDVGQGDALVLKGLDVSGKAHFALIDAGRTPVKLRECMTRLHITHLDLMVLTHYDLDHVGGVSAATGMVERVLMQKPAGFADDRLRSEVCSGHTACENGQAGLSGILGDASWQVIWPDGRTPEMQEGNPGSISMVVRWPEFSAAFVGDLGAAAQDELLAKTLDVPQVDVLKVAHHGSADTSARLVERFNPRIALVSVGVDNGYGHPTRKALGMLEALGTVIGRTDKQGFLFVSVSSGALRLDTDR
jgi:competence protein ComEC